MIFNTYWFRPKKYGIGATPTSWEGWALIISYLVCVVYFTYFLQNIFVYIFLLLIATIILILLSYCRTQGSWCWRWGNK
ncbi:MAG: hypothetical protein LAT82_05960 [Nanoarchaeota archaeon]|nr:hypothetical protein [Nanoarchaeota archaeon]